MNIPPTIFSGDYVRITRPSNAAIPDSPNGEENEEV